jgi:hypothetical protein
MRRHTTQDAVVFSATIGGRVVRVFVPHGYEWRSQMGNAPAEWLGGYVGRDRVRGMY